MVAEKGAGILEFETAKLTEQMNQLAREADLIGQRGGTFTNRKRVGWQLRRLRFKKATPGKTKRRWQAPWSARSRNEPCVS